MAILSLIFLILFFLSGLGWSMFISTYMVELARKKGIYIYGLSTMWFLLTYFGLRLSFSAMIYNGPSEYLYDHYSEYSERIAIGSTELTQREYNELVEYNSELHNKRTDPPTYYHGLFSFIYTSAYDSLKYLPIQKIGIESIDSTGKQKGDFVYRINVNNKDVKLWRDELPDNLSR